MIARKIKRYRPWRNTWLLALALPLACKEDPPPVQPQDAAVKVAKAEGDDGGVADSEPKLPIALDDLFMDLPQPPKPALGGVGADLSALAGEVDPSPFTPRILVQRIKDTQAFRGAQYLWEADRVRAVLMTFDALYARRSAEVEKAIRARLGEGERLLTTTYEGRSWRTLEQQITLRTDRVTGDLELLFQRQDP